MFFVMWLFVSEVRDFFRVDIRPELFVDNSKENFIKISMEIEFHHVPCVRKLFYYVFSSFPDSKCFLSMHRTWLVNTV